jgi:copper chaperone
MDNQHADADHPKQTEAVDSTISISGMSCAHCVAAVSAALATIPSLEVVSVRLGAAEVRSDGTPFALAAAKMAIEDAGFDVVSGRVLNVAPARPGDAPPVTSE